MTKARQLAQLPEVERQKVIYKGVKTKSGLKPIEEVTTEK